MTYEQLLHEPMVLKVVQFLISEYNLADSQAKNYIRQCMNFITTWLNDMNNEGTHLDYRQVGEKIIYAISVA